MNLPIEFYKLSGAGNDFVALVGSPPAGVRGIAQQVCRRGLSVGADGLFVIEQHPSIAHRVHMTHYNADGGQPDLCLNGARCAAKLAFFLGWGSTLENSDRNETKSDSSTHIELETGAGLLSATDQESGVRVSVPLPTTPCEQALLSPGGIEVTGFTCDTGVPHFVCLLEEHTWGKLDINTTGAWIRGHADLGPEGANVDFLYRPQKDGPWSLRTFERGVEGETLACGTGAVAAAATLRSLGEGMSHQFATQGGFDLQVQIAPPVKETNPEEEQWFLQGDARLVSKGVLLAGAFG